MIPTWRQMHFEIGRTRLTNIKRTSASVDSRTLLDSSQLRHQPGPLVTPSSPEVKPLSQWVERPTEGVLIQMVTWHECRSSSSGVCCHGNQKRPLRHFQLYNSTPSMDFVSFKFIWYFFFYRLFNGFIFQFSWMISYCSTFLKVYCCLSLYLYDLFLLYYYLLFVNWNAMFRLTNYVFD